MSEAKLEEIIEEVKALPPEDQEKFRGLLNMLLSLFVVGMGFSLLKKTLALLPDEQRQLRDALNRSLLEIGGSEAKADFIHSIRGKYAHLPITSDAFAASKVDEIDLEDRRRFS